MHVRMQTILFLMKLPVSAGKFFFKFPVSSGKLCMSFFNENFSFRRESYARNFMIDTCRDADEWLGFISLERSSKDEYLGTNGD